MQGLVEFCVTQGFAAPSITCRPHGNAITLKAVSGRPILKYLTGHTAGVVLPPFPAAKTKPKLDL